MGPTRVRSSLLAAAILLAAGCSSAASPGQSASAPVSTGPPATRPTTAAPSASPTATGPIATGGWQPVAAQDSIEGVALRRVVWTGARFVAAGSDRKGRAIFAHSEDARTWQAQPAARETARVTGLAAGPDGLVAVGVIGEQPASWYSSDGLEWTSQGGAFPASLTDADTVEVTGVVGSSTGWLAVGRDLPDSGIMVDLRPIRALLWTSMDGLHWTRLRPQPAIDEAAMNAVARIDRGYVAAGSRGSRAAIWTSEDAVAWAEVPDAPIFQPRGAAVDGGWATANAAVAAHGWVVVVGVVYGAGDGGAPVARAWRSNGDGGWQEAVVERSEVSDLRDVTAAGRQFLAVGTTWLDMSTCTGGIWASPDGAVWRCEAADPAFNGFNAGGTAASPSIEVVVGGTDSEWRLPGQSGVVWWRPAG